MIDEVSAIYVMMQIDKLAHRFARNLVIVLRKALEELEFEKEMTISDVMS